MENNNELNEIQTIIRNQNLKHTFFDDMYDDNLDLLNSIFYEVFSGDNNSYNDKYEFNKVLLLSMYLYIRKEEDKKEILISFFKERIITENIDILPILSYIERSVLDEMLNSSKSFIDKLFDNGYKPSYNFLEEYYKVNISNLDVEFFYKLIKFIDFTYTNIDDFISSKVSNEIIEKFIKFGFNIKVKFINNYIKRIQNTPTTFNNETFTLLLENCKRVNVKNIYEVVYKSLIKNNSIDLMKTFDYSKIDINENYQITKKTNIYDYIISDLNTNCIDILIKNGFCLKYGDLSTYIRLVLFKNNKLLKIFDFTKVDINENYKILYDKECYFRGRKYSERFNNIKKFINSELNIKSINILVDNGYILDKDFFDTFLKNKEEKSMEEINSLLELLNKQPKFINEYYPKIFSLLFSKNSYDLYLLIQKITDMNIINNIVNQLILNDKILLLSFILDSGYNLTKENIQTIKVNQDNQLIIEFISRKYPSQYDSVIPYII